MYDKSKFCVVGREVIKTEIEALEALLPRIDDNFIAACECILKCTGRIVVMGIGKPGYIARKFAATLSSTGTAAFFVHPAEASHGDIGMLRSEDVVMIFSNSGNTPEIVSILPALKRLKVKIIALTGNQNSILAKEAFINLDVSVAKEACAIGLAPTSSTTAALAMGDALSMALLTARNFTREDFALSHPGGILGKILTLKVGDLMHTNNDIPKVKSNTTLDNVLLEMTAKRLGMTTVVDEQNKLLGVFTDGDLRRALAKHIDIHTVKVSEVMRTESKTIAKDILAIDALKFMEAHAITSLVVVSETEDVMGVVHLHDILRAGLG